MKYKIIGQNPIVYLAADATQLEPIAREQYDSASKKWSFGVIVVLENGNAYILEEDGTWSNFGS